jgi:hypothetical protein
MSSVSRHRRLREWKKFRSSGEEAGLVRFFFGAVRQAQTLEEVAASREWNPDYYAPLARYGTLEGPKYFRPLLHMRLDRENHVLVDVLGTERFMPISRRYGRLDVKWVFKLHADMLENQWD